eukprot:CCRYP_017872-RB/>CCRYP_017872-RB protein AED:0.01 eAED:0.01 QI:49/1/1/1/1/1/2/538/616
MLIHTSTIFCLDHYSRHAWRGSNLEAMNTLTYFFLLLPAQLSAFQLPAAQSRYHVRPSSGTRLHSPVPVHKRPHRRKTALYMSNNSMPNKGEIAQQKAETYKALSSFHETRFPESAISNKDTSFFDGMYEDGPDDESNMAEYWECKEGAISYAVPMDPAAGLKKGVISKPYRSHVQIQTNIGRSRGELKNKGLRLMETIHVLKNDEITTLPFVRSIPLDANVDVDSVDGSYSLDDAVSSDKSSSPHLPLFPPSLLAGLNPSDVKFLVEHTIAVSDLERCRCFLLYGDADSDGDESKNADDGDDEDSVKHNYRLVGVVLAEESKKMPTQQKIENSLDDSSSLTTSKSDPLPSPPLGMLRADADENINQEKMDQLFQAITKHNKRVMSGSGGIDIDKPTMKRHSPGMFGICSGVYLGDTFIREPIPTRSSLRSNKGFGRRAEDKSNKSGEDDEDRFATWQVGVQKSTLQFQWDYSMNVVQTGTYGKSIGTMNSLSCTALYKSVGTVVVNEGRATKSREQRRVVWYMDGSYIAGLIGTGYFRVRTIFLLGATCHSVLINNIDSYFHKNTTRLHDTWHSPGHNTAEGSPNLLNLLCFINQMSRPACYPTKLQYQKSTAPK